MTMQRPYVDWPQARWDRLNEAVRVEVERARVLSRVLPRVSVSPETRTARREVYQRASPRAPLALDDAQTIRLSEPQLFFQLTREQLTDWSETQALTLAKRTAAGLALIEDCLVSYGQLVRPAGGAAPISIGRTPPVADEVSDGEPFDGLVAFALSVPAPRPVWPTGFPPPAQPVAVVGGLNGPTPGDQVADWVRLAVLDLQASRQLGPYVLFLAPELFAEIHQRWAPPVGGAPGSYRDPPRVGIDPLLDGQVFSFGNLAGAIGPPSSGVALLISTGSDAVDIVVAVEPTVSAHNQLPGEDVEFRVYERIALRVKDRSALRVNII